MWGPGKERFHCASSQEMTITSALPMTWELEPPRLVAETQVAAGGAPILASGNETNQEM